jgi:hypothetical protein
MLPLTPNITFGSVFSHLPEPLLEMEPTLVLFLSLFSSTAVDLPISHPLRLLTTLFAVDSAEKSMLLLLGLL